VLKQRSGASARAPAARGSERVDEARDGGEVVHGREPLEHADRIVGTEHGHAGGETDTAGTGGEAGEHGLRGRDRVLRTVVLTEGDDVDAGLLREHGLLDDLPDGSGVGHEGVGVVLRHIAEGGQAEDEIRYEWKLLPERLRCPQGAFADAVLRG
jgi:hypothetical protein